MSRERADVHAAGVLPVIRDLQQRGVTSLSGLAQELNRRAVLTPREGAWTTTAVRRVLSRGQRER